MKKIFFALVVILSTQHAWAQTQTLFGTGSKAPKLGAYGAPAVQFTSIDGKFGVLTGGYGGVLFNHKLMLGAGAYSLVNNIPLNVMGTDGNNQNLNFWYTGLMAEYIHSNDKLVHWTVGALIGGGGVSRRDKHAYDDDVHDNSAFDRTGAFVAEPFANLELNLTKFLKLDVGASYRYVNGTHTVGISDGKLSNGAIHVGLKAGLF
jgi:hypothetical protein